MKKLLFLVIILFYFSCSNNSTLTISKNDINGIKSNFDKQASCWNNADLVCYVSAYHPLKEIQTISRAGITKGYEDILASYKKYFPADKMGKLHFDNFSYKKLNQQFIYVVGRFNLTHENQVEPRRGWFSVLMEKEGNKWYIISDHSS